jgi:hypothetical protein
VAVPSETPDGAAAKPLAALAARAEPVARAAAVPSTTAATPSAAPAAAPSATPGAPAAAPLPSSSREKRPPLTEAQREQVRLWRAALTGGLITSTPGFAPVDGRYDLLLHLNGNTELVEESVGYAGLNAVVAILNLGVGSGKYEDRFAVPGAFDKLLERVQAVVEERGHAGARLGRVAVSGWSSGYGGVFNILAVDADFDRIDAVILFDSIHCGWDTSYPPRLKSNCIEPIKRFAQRAVEGRALLSITHSEIVTYGYLNTHDTTDKVLEAVGVPRVPATAAQPWPELAAMVNTLAKKDMVPLSPLTEAHRGGLHVRGYDGNGPITHMQHLIQMSTTALPDLAERWAKR